MQGPLGRAVRVMLALEPPGPGPGAHACRPDRLRIGPAGRLRRRAWSDERRRGVRAEAQMCFEPGPADPQPVTAADPSGRGSVWSLSASDGRSVGCIRPSPRCRRGHVAAHGGVGSLRPSGAAARVRARLPGPATMPGVGRRRWETPPWTRVYDCCIESRTEVRPAIFCPAPSGPGDEVRR